MFLFKVGFNSLALTHIPVSGETPICSEVRVVFSIAAVTLKIIY